MLSSYYNPKMKGLDIRKLRLRRYLEKVNEKIRFKSANKRKSYVPQTNRTVSTFIKRNKIEYEKTANKFSFLG